MSVKYKSGSSSSIGSNMFLNPTVVRHRLVFDVPTTQLSTQLTPAERKFGFAIVSVSDIMMSLSLSKIHTRAFLFGRLSIAFLSGRSVLAAPASGGLHPPPGRWIVTGGSSYYIHPRVGGSSTSSGVDVVSLSSAAEVDHASTTAAEDQEHASTSLPPDEPWYVVPSSKFLRRQWYKNRPAAAGGGIGSTLVGEAALPRGSFRPPPRKGGEKIQLGIPLAYNTTGAATGKGEGRAGAKDHTEAEKIQSTTAVPGASVSSSSTPTTSGAATSRSEATLVGEADPYCRSFLPLPISGAARLPAAPPLRRGSPSFRAARLPDPDTALPLATIAHRFRATRGEFLPLLEWALANDKNSQQLRLDDNMQRTWFYLACIEQSVVLLRNPNVAELRGGGGGPLVGGTSTFLTPPSFLYLQIILAHVERGELPHAKAIYHWFHHGRGEWSAFLVRTKGGEPIFETEPGFLGPEGTEAVILKLLDRERGRGPRQERPRQESPLAPNSRSLRIRAAAARTEFAVEVFNDFRRWSSTRPHSTRRAARRVECGRVDAQHSLFTRVYNQGLVAYSDYLNLFVGFGAPRNSARRRRVVERSLSLWQHQEETTRQAIMHSASSVLSEMDALHIPSDQMTYNKLLAICKALSLLDVLPLPGTPPSKPSISVRAVMEHMAGRRAGAIGLDAQDLQLIGPEEMKAIFGFRVRVGDVAAWCGTTASCVYAGLLRQQARLGSSSEQSADARLGSSEELCQQARLGSLEQQTIMSSSLITPSSLTGEKKACVSAEEGAPVPCSRARSAASPAAPAEPAAAAAEAALRAMRHIVLTPGLFSFHSGAKSPQSTNTPSQALANLLLLGGGDPTLTLADPARSSQQEQRHVLRSGSSENQQMFCGLDLIPLAVLLAQEHVGVSSTGRDGRSSVLAALISPDSEHVTPVLAHFIGVAYGLLRGEFGKQQPGFVIFNSRGGCSLCLDGLVRKYAAHAEEDNTS